MSTPTIDTATLNAMMPLGAHLGIEVVLATPDRVELSMRWAEFLCTSSGILHGGALMTLADSSGALLALLNLPEGAGTTTISSNTVFLRGVREGEVTTTSTLVHRGRTTIVVETELVGAEGKPAMRTTQTQAVLTR